MKGYKTSKDYKRLKELLDKGYNVICWADYGWGDTYTARDICLARGKDGHYSVSARGIEYMDYWPGMYQYKSFEDACKDVNIEFIEPTEE